MTVDKAASVHARLLHRAKQRGEDFNHLLNRYAVERFLYRLSVSSANGRFLLKGALLFDLWFDAPHRPTRDADFLGLIPEDEESITTIIRGICAIGVVDDGMTFDPTSIALEPIRDHAPYGGLRVKLLGMLGNARCPLQLDIGFGDTVTPSPEEIDYPALLGDLPSPRLRVCPRATVIAEKLEAIVRLGFPNSRMKDYFDLHALAREGVVDPALLAQAIAATFTRRGTALPIGLPIGLCDAFAADGPKQRQWDGFLRKNRLEAGALQDVVHDVRAFVEVPMQLARAIMERQ